MPNASEPHREGLSFSVIVPAYNSAETLAETLESTVAQTYPPLEVLVVDDGSTDATAEIAAGFGPPVRVLRQPNGGTASARNHGIREARGDVVVFLDADDLYEPARLAEIAAKLGTEPELDAVITDAALVSPGECRLASSWWPEGASRERLDARIPVIFCTVAIRREVLRELGEFDGRYSIVEDVEYWHRLSCRRYAIGYVDSPSYVYRIHPDSKTGSRSPVDGLREFFEINLRYALGRGTPLRLRLRLAVRAVRYGRGALRAWAAAR